ncbi:MAG TPA: hypothetical protein VKD90_18485 [Gemmataceae bacterium]|nr:hypothetical protein [Gemmataceae bacterium]
MSAELPYSAEEWDAIQWAAGAVTRAAQAGDSEARAARFADFQSILNEVRQRHGNHPILWEMEADFTVEPRAAAELYVRAERASEALGRSTVSIRLSLARLLLEEMGQPEGAKLTLESITDQLPRATNAQCAHWAELLARCEGQLPTDPDLEVPPTLDDTGGNSDPTAPA